MDTPTLALWSDDPILGEVVAHVLVREGWRVAPGGEAPLVVAVRTEVIEVRSDGVVAGRLVRPFWEHDLLAVIARVAPASVAP